ncbi:MAG TPA: GMC family oxidoreductase [Candidatus Elarobacter sp.]
MNVVLSATQRAVLDALADTFAPPDADRDATRELVASALARLAPHRRAKLILVLNLLASPLAGLALAGRAAGFARLDPGRRERALLRLATIGPLRPAFDAFSRLSLFAAYSAASDEGRSAVWERLRYPGPRGDVPANGGALPVSSPPAGGRLVADAVVIGSGAGGGVAAALLAQAGLRVVVLEAGPPFEPVAARQREAESFAELYLEAGLCSTEDLSVSLLAGACVGGGTAVNWSTSLRLPPATAAEWATALGRAGFGAELADAYDAVETRLGVTVSTSHNRNNGVIVAGCERLGWEMRAIPRNAQCTGDGCGYCGFGCAYGTKRSTAATYLRDAVDAGAQVFARTRVVRVRTERTGAERDAVVHGVEAVIENESGDGATPRPLVVDAPLVIAAAGTLRTPGILARSGITSPHLGRHLRLHPVGAISAAFAEPVDPWLGVMQSALCDRFAALNASAGSGAGRFGYVIEAAPTHPGLMGLALPWAGRAAHAELMTGARYRATLIVIARDEGEGSVGLDERADVRYRIAGADARRLADGLGAAARIALAAGAVSARTLYARPLELTAADATPDGLAGFETELRRRAERRVPLPLFSAHQMGTARMGASAAEGVIDPDGRVYGVEGLLVVDASAFPSASGVNPMLTIMALAHRATRALIARRAGSVSSGSPAPSRS